MSNKTPIQQATEQANVVWKQVFEEGPYTALVMIDYLRYKANIAGWNEVLKLGVKQKTLVALSQMADKREAMMKDPDLNRIWAGQTGRCTSFAVKVISLLERQSPGIFNFNIYDIGHHRVARCHKTGILIDSSSKVGAFPLPEGKKVRIEASDASWKWTNGKSKFEKVEGSSGVKESGTVITKQEALVTCLLELPAADSIPTLIRSINPATQRTEYHTLVRWVWKSKALEIYPDFGSKRKMIVEFKDGTDDTNLQCVVNLVNSIKNWGGRNGIHQWATVSSINATIWDAAINVWGKPRWSEVKG